MGPSRIYLIGFMGAGKSTIGRQLAKKLGWKFIDLDDEIERHERRSIPEIFKQNGEPYFRDVERRCLKNLSSSPKTVIALGGGAFVDQECRDYAERTGLTVWLKASFPQLAARVKIDGRRPKFAEKEEAERLYHSREPVYSLAKVHIATEDGTPDSAADEIIEVVRKL